MKKLLFFLLILSVSCSGEIVEESLGIEEISLAQKYIIAHRGTWNKSDAPQNSREALKKSLALNIYGTEFDVRQTKDGYFVINHDATFKGVEIAKSTFQELNQYTLSNGEKLPLLEDFLDVKKNTRSDVRLIVELKQGDVNQLVDLINQYGLQEQVDYISFVKSYCEQLVQKGYGSKTYYLGGNMTPSDVKELGIGGINYQHGVFNKNPNYIDVAKVNGLKVLVWTVNDLNLIKDYFSKEVIVTTDYSEYFK